MQNFLANHCEGTMSSETVQTTAPVVVQKTNVTKPTRHWLEQNPPRPIRAFTIPQIVEMHPGFKGKLPGMIHKADAGDPEFKWLKVCIIRLGRSLYIDDVMLRHGLQERTATGPAPDRGGGRKPKKAEPDTSAA